MDVKQTDADKAMQEEMEAFISWGDLLLALEESDLENTYLGAFVLGAQDRLIKAAMNYFIEKQKFILAQRGLSEKYVFLNAALHAYIQGLEGESEDENDD